MRFYIVYRALVRALVEVLKARRSSAAHSLARARDYAVLMDATFLKQRHRASFIELACVFDVPVFLLDFHTSARQLAERVRKRATDPGQSSDANAAVLVRQLANEEPRTPDEAALTVAFDTDVPLGAFQHATYWKPLLIRLRPNGPVEHAVHSGTHHWQTSGWDAVGCQRVA